MRKQPVIAWSGGSDYVPPNLSGIAQQDTQGQLRVTPERLARAEAQRLFNDLLAHLGVGKW